MATVDCFNGPPPPKSVLELCVFDLPGRSDALEKQNEISLIMTISNSSSSSSSSSSSKKVKFKQ
jgi:hypothetical protein